MVSEKSLAGLLLLNVSFFSGMFLDDEITARLKSTSLDIVTRSGNPASCRDLAMVAAGQADTVIVLHPDSHTSQQAAEAVKAATAMALSVEGRHSTQKVVMQMPNELTVNDYMKSFTRTVLQLPDGNFMDRFTCHTALQPGVFRVWLKILQQGPSNVKLRVKALPAMLHGRTFAEVRRSFRDCIVVGYIRGQDPCFDPLDTQVMLPEQDRLIVLSYVASPAPCTQAQPIYKVAANAASERLARPATYQPAPRKVIVAGWHAPELPDMVQGFADAAPEASQITFILRQDAGIKTADAVVLGMNEELQSQVEADALVLASLLQVQDAVIASGRARAPHVVAKVHRFGTMQVINQYFDMLYPKQPVAPRSHPVPAHQALQPQKPAPATPLALSRLWHIPESVLLEAQEIQAAAA
ncbi:uncharacterized protein HaLaN_15798, partial [Haematococcus lacustris]